MVGSVASSTAPLTAPQFVSKWREMRQKESAVAHEHFLDLCTLLDQPTPATADPTGASFAFEKKVAKIDGRRGFADVWKRNYFAWEYKGKNEDLTEAYQQLLQYRESLENPPLLVVCNIAHFHIHTNFTGTAKQVHHLKNEDLTAPETLRTLRAVFEHPEALKPGTTVAQVTEAAAAKFATLAVGLQARGIAARRAAHFLTQLLFCMFAEDVGLLKKEPFTQLLVRAVERPSSFTRHITALFEAMRDGTEFYLYEIPHFNGRLMAEIDPIELTGKELLTLAEATQLDWSTIEPAIMGTLFERSLDPTKRSQLGAHYTSRDDIQHIVEPVLMEPLRHDWAAVRMQADRLREPEVHIATTESDRQHQRKARKNQQSLLAELLKRFKERLASVRVLDPAAGSGNFLAVALAELLALDKEVVSYGALAGLPHMLPDVSPRQMYGIEVNPYAYELAQVSVWIAYLQWLTANGFGFHHRPVLQTLDTIRQEDAVLDLTDPACPQEPAWPEVDVIVSNPPYLGGKRLRAELGDAYVDSLFAIYDGRVPRESDRVCYWYEKARAHIADGRARRAGLLATNSIRGGANRRVLERIKQTGDIFMAWSDRRWVLDGAAVRISMLGFDDGTQIERTLDGQPVTTINADLTGTLDITAARPLPENKGLAFMGDTKGGPFDIPGDLARQWLALPPNPNARPNSDVVRPWVNGFDVTRRPRDMWIIDFGVDMVKEDAALYEMPFEYVRTHVKPVRATNNRASYREQWWLHAEARLGMRAALEGRRRFVGTARVAKHRLFVWLDSDTLADSQIIAIARDDDYFLGVLHSRLHELWSLRMCSWLGAGNDPRYTPTTTFETFPFPWQPSREPPADARIEAIAQAARSLVHKRERWLYPLGATEVELKRRTLTNLYNMRPTWLNLAHQQLDHAVLDAYGWPRNLANDEIVTRLLMLNLQRAGAKNDDATEVTSPQQLSAD